MVEYSKVTFWSLVLNGLYFFIKRTYFLARIPKMQNAQLLEKFDNVLNGNDVEALKTALQNLMLLFENQNRNYLELKEQVKNLKFKKPQLSFEKGDEFTIANEETRPNMEEGIVQNSYDILASIRMSRKITSDILTQAEKTIEKFSTQEKLNNTKISTIIHQDL
ncbi:hypothetical protein TRFO_36242 [Tritrichomonas foetus]|uniref:Uncharacterized protein n=1 Tax=Tritrichomonas foetus TaxID=1144522 RepID=A0A1J4JJW7_9EUKA|nr:hypothetical protein TRFO_36242 [Tritrichomonas foetus]|eukprot:OHS97548.1 hypothetical protein TRFO_36242 [Tritrichomonas foetus]